MATRPLKKQQTPEGAPFAALAMTPKLLPLREIIPYEKNPRTHPASQVTLLAKLMKQYGIDQPIVTDEDGIILKGHGRLLAAQEAGFETFPVVRRLGLSEADKKAMRLQDNQVALLSGWDRELIAGEVKDLRLAGYDIPLLGFSPDYLDSLKLTGMLSDLIQPGADATSSSAVAAGHRGVSVRFDLMPGDRDVVISWLAAERDKRNLRTTAEALVAIAREETE